MLNFLKGLFVIRTSKALEVLILQDTLVEIYKIQVSFTKLTTDLVKGLVRWIEKVSTFPTSELSITLKPTVGMTDKTKPISKVVREEAEMDLLKMVLGSSCKVETLLVTEEMLAEVVAVLVIEVEIEEMQVEKELTKARRWEEICFHQAVKAYQSVEIDRVV